MTAFLRPILIFVLVFMLLGIFVASYFGPLWLETSLCGFTQDMLTDRPCKQTVIDATSALIRYQLYGMGVGASSGLILGVIFAMRGRGSKKSEPPSLEAPPTAPTV
ncbi:MAG: hypothetical protein GX614_01185 [Sandaracinaceae bacterium]|nr:hypothetical protein [Sandaracinaceae bacterium]